MLRVAPAPAALAILMATSACVPTGHLTTGRAPTPPFDAVAFFAGPTHGEGRLKIATRAAQTVVVKGSGRITADGSIILDQSVRQGARSATQRQWQLHSDAPGHYVGTLTDAVGPVEGIVTGNLLHLKFTARGGLKTEQFLVLQPGGQQARNVMIVRKFGLPLARLDETIARVGQ